MENRRRIALVTGANKGIGSAVARALGAKGLVVLVGARELAAGERIASEIREVGGQASAVRVDVTDTASIEAAAASVRESHGRLDVLVNNAGISDRDDGPVSTAKLDALRRIFEVNVLGVLAVTQAFLPLVRESSGGRIVNVSSALGSLALVGPLDSPYKVPTLGYKTSKAALDMMTVELARELRETPIKVNAAAPGYTLTDLNKHLISTIGAQRKTQTTDEAAKVIVELSLLPDEGPTGRFFSNEGEIAF